MGHRLRLPDRQPVHQRGQLLVLLLQQPDRGVVLLGDADQPAERRFQVLVIFLELPDDDHAGVVPQFIRRRRLLIKATLKSC